MEPDCTAGEGRASAGRGHRSLDWNPSSATYTLDVAVGKSLSLSKPPFLHPEEGGRNFITGIK